MGERTNWGLEHTSPTITDVCPSCGANKTPSRQTWDEGNYDCGSVYPSRGENQSDNCRVNSHATRRRAATINGILDACTRSEAKGVIARIMYNEHFKQFKLIAIE